MIRIVVGSESPLKIEAVKAAVAELGLAADIVAMKTGSGVPPQPYGRQETVQGALTRALMAQGAHPGAYAVGIENGLMPIGMQVCDVAYVVVLTPDAGLYAMPSEPVAVPDDLVVACLGADQMITAGELQAERDGGDPADPHRAWSGGKTDRATILKAAIRDTLLAATRTERGEPS